MKKLLIAILYVTGTFLVTPSSHAGPQWAYNMASYECSLLRKGTSRDKATEMSYKKFPEYRKYIDEYGVGPLVIELFNQCPELVSDSPSTSTSSESKSECSPSFQQINTLRRGSSLGLRGKNCLFSIIVH